MAMSRTDCQRFLQSLVPKIEQHLLGGQPLTAFGGAIRILPRLRVVEGGANAILCELDETSMGVEVNDILLMLTPENSVKFAIAHELGHAFSEPLLQRLGLGAVSGCPTEVVADLGAAYTLHLLGMSWTDIKNTAINGARDGIFDIDWSGDHPPGYMRAHAVCSLADLMSGGESFDLSAQAITLSVLGMRQGTVTVPGPNAGVVPHDLNERLER